ncbi:hypothetical protein SeMB42_g06581 [Synchytrium endobioticum]|uniref:Uncharacterized protein n=1 Tax=Synchytrium endobioticum TaxID=286115 RepID=A0A507CAW3_9FUNG|nr:hypothetical protein SeMB42_g06581 [Synchytrium endobioticum]
MECFRKCWHSTGKFSRTCNYDTPGTTSPGCSIRTGSIFFDRDVLGREPLLSSFDTGRGTLSREVWDFHPLKLSPGSGLV